MVKKLLEPFKEVVNMVKCILGELFMLPILFLENFPARMMCYIYLGVEKSITRKNMKFWFRMKKQGMPGFLHQRAKFHKKQFQVKNFVQSFVLHLSWVFQIFLCQGSNHGEDLVTPSVMVSRICPRTC